MWFFSIATIPSRLSPPPRLEENICSMSSFPPGPAWLPAAGKWPSASGAAGMELGCGAGLCGGLSPIGAPHRVGVLEGEAAGGGQALGEETWEKGRTGWQNKGLEGWGGTTLSTEHPWSHCHSQSSAVPHAPTPLLCSASLLMCPSPPALPSEDYKRHFAPRDLQVFSAHPLLVYPTHYAGDSNWLSDTETSTIWDDDSKQTGWVGSQKTLRDPRDGGGYLRSASHDEF